MELFYNDHYITCYVSVRRAKIYFFGYHYLQLLGGYNRTFSRANRQAKFHLPRQATAAEVDKGAVS